MTRPGQRCEVCGGEVVGHAFDRPTFCSRICWERNRTLRQSSSAPAVTRCHSCERRLTPAQTRTWGRFCS